MMHLETKLAEQEEKIDMLAGMVKALNDSLRVLADIAKATDTFAIAAARKVEVFEERIADLECEKTALADRLETLEARFPLH